MQYIIMCGGNYKHWEKPRHLSVVRGEELVARTIRLLRENGIKDIAISSDNPIFEKFGVPILKHDNLYVAMNAKIEEGEWFNCFYPTEEPVCYMFGDVYFSDEAIKTIVETETDDIEFFGSQEPFAKEYIKTHVEPFALKVVNQKHLREAIEKTKEMEAEGRFWRKPIMWELWTVIKGVEPEVKGEKYPADYVAINDYTCDIDWKDDILKLERNLGGNNMVKVEAIENFTLGRFNELTNIKRKGAETPGQLNEGDIFECTNELYEYLNGNNAKGKVVVKLLEVIPEKAIVKESEKEDKSKPKTTKKKATKK